MACNYGVIGRVTLQVTAAERANTERDTDATYW
jgi:hypothetical protein